MKIYIFVDMEGISGISGGGYVSEDHRLYQTGRKFYTWDINACVKGCIEAGAESVIVRDGHSCGQHAILEELDPRAELIQGDSGLQRMPGLGECAGLILLGYHAMAGTTGALLEHTMSSRGIQNIWLNGRQAGEIALDAGIASDHGIPTIMVSGDDYACSEAREFIPGVVTCEVKKGLSTQGARLLPLEEAHTRITEAAAEAVRKLSQISPMPLARPLTLRLEVTERGANTSFASRKNTRIINGRTREVTADTINEALLSIL